MWCKRVTLQSALKPWLLSLTLLWGTAVAEPAQTNSFKVVVDTDLGFASDDAMALFILLQSESVELLGVSVVTGNQWRDQEVANALRLLELAGRADIPVYPGAETPLVTNIEEMKVREQTYGDSSEGSYKGAWREGSPGPKKVHPPDGKFAQRKPEPTHASDFLIEATRQHPGEVVLVAIGPLTNVALALAKDPEIASRTKAAVIMGGGIGTRPEFNFWMDPEAARIVLRAPWPKLTLTPLNICYQAPYTRDIAASLAKGDSPIAHYFSETQLKGNFPNPVSSFMYDQVAVLSLIEPKLVKRAEPMWLDVDISHGPSYGSTLFWNGKQRPMPGSRQVDVQLDLDYNHFVDSFIALMKKPIRRASSLQSR
jgi:purine nucleosidase